MNSDGTYTISSLPSYASAFAVYAKADGYVKTWNGNVADNPSSTDLSSYGTTVSSGTDVGITLQEGTTFTGTVTPAGVDKPSVQVCALTPASYGSGLSEAYPCTTAIPSADGKYTVTVAPSGSYDVYATATGYLKTYYGTCPSAGVASCNANSAGVTQVQAAKGASTTANIALVQPSTITGSIAGSAATNLQVFACQIQQGSVGRCVAGTVGATGAYTIGSTDSGHQYDLAPGTDYGIYATADGDVPTWLGGYSGTDEPTWAGNTPASITAVHTPAQGGTVQASAAITLQQGAIITGTISPAGAANIAVSVCRTQIDTDGTITKDQCQSPEPGSDGTYSVVVVPGSQNVVYASADGYLNTWLGNVVAATSPVPDQATRVTAPAAGKSVTENITLQQESSISGTVTLPAGHTLVAAGTGTSGPTVMASSTADYSQQPATIQSDGKFTISGLADGQEYEVCIDGDAVTPADLGLLCYNATAANSYGDAVKAPAQGITVAPTVGVQISGTVSLPDKKPAAEGSVVLYAVQGTPTGKPQAVAYAQTDDNGAYSLYVAPQSGVTYALLGEGPRGSTFLASSYQATWLGGQAADSVTDLSQLQGTFSLTAAKSGQDITLVQPASIQGQLTNYTAQAGAMTVTACPVTAPAVSYGYGCTQSATIGTDGKYTVAGLASGVSYWVSAVNNDYSATSSNDYTVTTYATLVGNWDLPHDGATQVTAPKDGVNIPMTKSATISGTISPASVYQQGTGAWVEACPVYSQNGQTYYQNNADTGGAQAGLVENTCVGTTVDSSSVDGSCSLGVTPGQKYVVIAGTDGYADAWAGGFSGDSDLNRVSIGTQSVLPASAQITQVTAGAAGEATTANLTFASASVTVTFDPDGGILADQQRRTAPGSVVALPTPTPNPDTQAGLAFQGWFTEKNGGGSQLTAATPVTADITVYAKWGTSQQNTNPGGNGGNPGGNGGSGDNSGNSGGSGGSGNAGSSDGVSSANGLLSSVTATPAQVSGKTVVGATVTVRYPDGSVQTVVAGADGSWSMKPTATLQPGQSVTVTAVSGSSTATVTVTVSKVITVSTGGTVLNGGSGGMAAALLLSSVVAAVAAGIGITGLRKRI